MVSPLLLLLARSAAVLPPASGTFNTPPPPITAPVAVRTEDLAVPPGASLRAATMEGLVVQPRKPVHIPIACMVLDRWGMPLTCYPADIIGAPSSWSEFFERGRREPSTARSELTAVALIRAYSSRLRPNPNPSDAAPWRLVVLDQLISPEDAAPQPAPADQLTAIDIKFEERPSAEILAALYPAAAMRAGAASRVTIICRIQRDRRLFCRRPPLLPVTAFGVTNRPDLNAAFIYASFQAASLMRIAPKTLKSEKTVGRDLLLNFQWKMPD
jgi:hypothetical protein